MNIYVILGFILLGLTLLISVIMAVKSAFEVDKLGGSILLIAIVGALLVVIGCYVQFN